MFHPNYLADSSDVKSLFHGCGSFGEIRGDLVKDGQTISQETADYKIQCEYEMDENGVLTRNDVFENVSGKPMSVTRLKSRFVFDGGEYQVYTQFNGWQNESSGKWQPLVSSVSVTGGSSRLTNDAAPFLCLWDEQNNRGVAFHLVPNCSWEMKVTRACHYSKYSRTVVEMGICDYNFNMTLEPGQKIQMPQIICYEVRNRLDMDCYKLHNYMHTRYPRKSMPMMYSTWMVRFDHIDFDDLAKQVDLAAEMGLEYFNIDAGWFGKGASWSRSVGDWSENQTGAFCGRMKELADRVRERGMKFGLWLEPERACPTSDSVKEHPEYYIQGDSKEYYFLDFANDKAREWMLSVVFDLIEKYGIAYIKDDYNADMYYDEYHTSFLKYHEGHAKFIQAIHDRYPDLYLTNCGSGGERLDLGSYMKFDSAWPSDNESPTIELRMYRDTILRMPPQGFERWVAVHSLKGFESFYENFKGSNAGNTDRIVACYDAVWHNLESVQPSCMEGFMTCGPVGISSDLTLLSEQTFAAMKSYIARFKEEREFWIKAVARILTDTRTVTTYQYSDMDLNKIVVQLFTRESIQDRFHVYPVVDANKSYRTEDGKVLTGEQINEEGFIIQNGEWMDNWKEMHQIVLEAV